MNREGFLDWAEAMLANQLGTPVTRQSNNVQRSFLGDIGIGVVANVQPLEVRVHLFSYDAARQNAWQSSPGIGAAFALPLDFRTGPGGTVAYLEFSAPVAAPDDFARWRAPVFGYVAFLVAARAASLIP